MPLLRRLIVALLLGTLAFGNTAATKKPRPTTLYLSTGTSEGGCSPTRLTTRPEGASNCGSTTPTGGTSTWTSPADDEGYPFETPPGTEVEGQVTFGTSLIGYQDFTLEITVSLNGTVVHEQSTKHDGGLVQEYAIEEFTFNLPEGMDWIEDGKVDVTVDGVSIRGSFIDGSGGSYLKFPPALA